MGYNIAILDERRAQKGDDDVHSARAELEECIHFHTDAVRLVFTTQEMLKIADIFITAKKELLAMGSPDTLPQMKSFGSVMFNEPCLHNDRFAVEVTLDGTVHIHHKNLRLHLSQMDFYDVADGFKDAVLTLCDHLKTEIDITASNITYHPIADKYIEQLNSYIRGNGDRAIAEEVSKLKYDMRRYEVLPNGPNTTTEQDIQRPTGRLPDKFPGNIPDDLNKAYLLSLYESVRKWGYADGPFYGDLMPAYKYQDGRIYLKGAHRTAVLKVIGYTNIEVALSKPPTAWTE